MKGVFCLEGYWYGDHRDKTSVFPVLDLLNRYNNLPFLHHRCCTKEEFVFALNRWKNKSFYKKYPLLYLAFHGDKGKIKIGNNIVTLEELSQLLAHNCQGVVIYFGSCATMKMDRRNLQNFMTKTNALAILGYKQEVNWLISASFDIRLLSYLNDYPLDTKGVKDMEKAIKTDCKAFVRELDFRMEINDLIHIPRKRKK